MKVGLQLLVTVIPWVLISPSAIAASGSPTQIMSALPRKLIQVKVKSGSVIIHKGKCCADEVHRDFSRVSHQWFITGNVGFEEAKARIVKTSRIGNWIVLDTVQENCSNCQSVRIELTQDSRRSYLWHGHGDPFIGPKYKSDWIDARKQAKAHVEVEDDCPKDGDAC